MRLQILISGSCLVAYADGETALSSRMHQYATGALGLFASDGAVTFSDVSVRLRA